MKKGFLIDMDGVSYRSAELIPLGGGPHLARLLCTWPL
jgi:hypothetical protein